ncbi:four helix bundle protein [Patescibacteria group bacterium]|nr:four helix bundle protein [Patescibacteria group bacterium]
MSKRKSQNHNSNVKTDLKIRSYQFSLRIIRLVSRLPSTRIFWVIGDQLLRNSTSIGANIVETKSSSSKKEFIKFYEISLKSTNETKYWLCLLRDSNLEGIDQKTVKEAL